MYGAKYHPACVKTNYTRKCVIMLKTASMMIHMFGQIDSLESNSLYHKSRKESFANNL